LPIEKAAAHGKRASDRGKEGKSKGGPQGQGLVAKPQLTGRAALALAVMEAGGNHHLLLLLLLHFRLFFFIFFFFKIMLSSSSVAPKLLICE